MNHDTRAVHTSDWNQSRARPVAITAPISDFTPGRFAARRAPCTCSRRAHRSHLFLRLVWGKVPPSRPGSMPAWPPHLGASAYSSYLGCPASRGGALAARPSPPARWSWPSIRRGHHCARRNQWRSVDIPDIVGTQW